MRKPSRSNLLALLLCGSLLATYAALSWSASLHESATADEPLHALAGYTRWFYGDFRLDTEHPPLWEYWAMLPHRRDELKLDFNSSIWQRLPATFNNQATWATQTLYQTPGNDPIAFIQKSRAMMLIIAVLLGAVLAAWAWRLGGPAAGVIACALFSFDPNFIGHGPLVVNDVSMAFGLLAVAWAMWWCGRTLTVARALPLVVAVAATINVKYSALLIGPIVLSLLLVRVFVPSPSYSGERVRVRGRAQRAELPDKTKEPLTPTLSPGYEGEGEGKSKITFCIGLLIASALASVAMIWLCYGLRGAPTPSPTVALNLDLLGVAVKWTHSVAAAVDHRPPTPAQLAQLPLPLAARAALFANELGLLPQAYLAGFLHTLNTTLFSRAFLLSEIRSTGWWYYFPLAICFKTPLASLSSFAMAGIRVRFRDYWTAACLAIPPLIFLIAAMMSNLNIGIRHVLPIYPFLFVGTGVVLSRLLKSSAGRVVVAGLGLLLITESAVAFPNDLSYFNLACGGFRGGLRLLGDSNLDWGQDLPRLRDWQQANPQFPIYLSYFGMADPAYYVRSKPLLTDDLRPPTEPCVLAISANTLQGIYLQPDQQRFIHALTDGQTPFRVIGGSIYLFYDSANQRTDSGSIRQ